MSNDRLYRKDCPELITEYPFFRDGMTCEQFEYEQILFCEYMNNGGNVKDYIPSFENNEGFSETIEMMRELDELADKAGGFVSQQSSSVQYNYREINEYCKTRGIEPIDLTVRELSKFIVED
ncbi:MAG: hypothetical protein UGF89_03245 [Acutalibacteraceae bacterium]|nr:hypothetical protein [Acutalibacteraceae bacterium]